MRTSELLREIAKAHERGEFVVRMCDATGPSRARIVTERYQVGPWLGTRIVVEVTVDVEATSVAEAVVDALTEGSIDGEDID